MVGKTTIAKEGGCDGERNALWAAAEHHRMSGSRKWKICVPAIGGSPAHLEHLALVVDSTPEVAHLAEGEDDEKSADDVRAVGEPSAADRPYITVQRILPGFVIL